MLTSCWRHLKTAKNATFRSLKFKYLRNQILKKKIKYLFLQLLFEPDSANLFIFTSKHFLFPITKGTTFTFGYLRKMAQIDPLAKKLNCSPPFFSFYIVLWFQKTKNYLVPKKKSQIVQSHGLGSVVLYSTL